MAHVPGLRRARGAGRRLGADRRRRGRRRRRAAIQRRSSLRRHHRDRAGASGQGHGRRLLAFVETEARRRGRDETRLQLHLTMTRGIALYRRLGYTEYARREVDGYYRVYLCKRLRE